MARGIIILGPAGSGKTTLGRMVADALGFPYFDIDDYIWRWDVPVPYTVMRTREEKISGLTNAIAPHEYFCMAGSMSSFHQHFDPFFDLAILLTCDPATRAQRIHARELASFGDRILPGGDMYDVHLRFLESVADYESGAGSPNLPEQLAWLRSLPCKTLQLDGAQPLERNRDIIVAAYRDR